MIETAYTRLFNVLRERILGSTYTPGEKLPTERELCEEFGISRITCRHALRLLQEQGLVERLPGKGTFVRSIQPKKVPILDNNYIESMRRAAPNTRRILSECEEKRPPEDIAKILHLFRTQSCLYAVRVDVVGEEAIAFDRAYIPLQFASALDEELLIRVDFLDLWLERQALKFSHIWSSIEAVPADNDARKTLKIPLRAPVLLTTDIVYVEGGTTVGLFETIYRGDRFKLISTNIRGGVHAKNSNS
ncbi:MAG TPA: GntR family transcriptional regulator [Spirochaetia bacterium]|nr:GntR family transcriptional regulator [Spirochaetia bacterium]